MKYMLLIYGDESQDSNDPADLQKWFDVTEKMGKAGVMLAGDALLPTTSATTLRIRNGETVTTDGPFAETREQLGGYYLLECDDLDQALEWAAKLPNAPTGSVEVRPVMEFDQG